MKTETSVQMTAAEAAFIARFTAEKCRPHAEVLASRLATFVAERRSGLLAAGEDFALAAAPRHAVDVARAVSPAESVSFTFASDATEGAGCWRATLVVPPKATAVTPIAVEVTDGAGAPVDGAAFLLGGCTLPLVGGKAELPFGVFLAGIQKASVALLRAAQAPSPGKLAFF